MLTFTQTEREQDFSASNFEVVYAIASKHISNVGNPKILFF